MAVNYFRSGVARKCGVNAALVAELLRDRCHEQMMDEVTESHYGGEWFRCSQPMLSAMSSCLSVNMVKSAVQTLVKKGVIRKERFNDSKFDKTNWYSFTEYGIRLMNEDED